MNATPQSGDALVIVDVQRDFVTGSLAVEGAEEIVAVLERCIRLFRERGLTVVATRDWHPPDHVSFREQGGVWPAHCVAGTSGAEFAPGLSLGKDTIVVSKATRRVTDAYSAFDATGLDALLRGKGIERLFVGGLATDYCVLATVKDALRLGYRVFVLLDAIRAVDREPEDGAAAVRTMLRLGAAALREAQLAPGATAHG